MMVMMGMTMTADKTCWFDKKSAGERGWVAGMNDRLIALERAAVDSCCRLPAKAYGGEIIEKMTWTGRIQDGRAPVVWSMPGKRTL